MADDDFFEKLPFQPGSTQILQLDLTQLFTSLAPSLVPDDVLVETNASRPAIASPTTGPHRYTIYAPFNEGARLNVGAANPSKGQAGITLDTLSHIHLNAYGGGHATTLSLGLPALDVGGPPNRETTGYALFTEGASTHVAKGQLFFASEGQSLCIKAKHSITLDAEEDLLSLSAKKDISVVSESNVNITAKKGAEEAHASGWSKLHAYAMIATTAADFGGGAAASRHGEATAAAAENAAGLAGGLELIPDEAAEELATQMLKTAGNGVDKALTHLESIVAMVVAFKKSFKEPQHGFKGWKNRLAWAKWGVTVAAEVKSLIGDFKELAGSTPEAGVGQIKINAAKSISLDADSSIKLTATNSVSINAIKAASVSGTIAASLKAHKTASVFGGMGASVKAMAGDVELASDYKEAKITAKKDVKITSETEHVLVTGEEDVQLNSIKGQASLHGEKAFYVGRGTGEGFGIRGDAKKLVIGRVQSADKFPDAKEKLGNAFLFFLPKTVQFEVTGDSMCRLRENVFEVKSPEVKLTSTGKPMVLKADKILLG